MCAGNQKLLASHSVVALFMNGTLFAGFPKAKHWAERLCEIECERVVVYGRNLGRMRQEELTKAIFFAPALERLNAVFRPNRFTESRIAGTAGVLALLDHPVGAQQY